MEFNSKLFFSALGLAFILEALPYTLFPERMRQVLQTLGEEGASGLYFTWITKYLDTLQKSFGFVIFKVSCPLSSFSNA